MTCPRRFCRETANNHIFDGDQISDALKGIDSSLVADEEVQQLATSFLQFKQRIREDF